MLISHCFRMLTYCQGMTVWWGFEIPFVYHIVLKSEIWSVREVKTPLASLGFAAGRLYDLDFLIREVVQFVDQSVNLAVGVRGFDLHYTQPHLRHRRNLGC